MTHTRATDAEDDCVQVVDVQASPLNGTGDSAHLQPKGAELQDSGPDVAACVEEAVARLRSPDRPPSLNAVKSGARSTALWDALAPAKAAIIARVRTDLGIVDDDAAETLLRTIDAYAEASLLRESQFAQLVQLGGPATPKGKSRVHLTAWATAVDRESRLAQVIGLARRARPVDPLAAVHAAVVEANRR